MKKLVNEYIIRDKETGTTIESVSSIDEAKKIIEEYEEEDKKNDSYEVDYYEIYDLTNEKIVH